MYTFKLFIKCYPVAFFGVGVEVFPQCFYMLSIPFRICYVRSKKTQAR